MRRLSLALILLASALAWPGCADSSVIAKGPILQCPGPHEMTILWECGADVGTAVVRYGKGNLDASPQGQAAEAKEAQVKTIEVAAGPEVLSGKSKTDSTKVACRRYEARLAGLDAAATYNYRVEIGGKSVSSAAFTTFPEKDSPAGGKFTFVAYGDSRTNGAIHAKVARQFARLNPAFVLHSGDYVLSGPYWQNWKEMFFDPTRKVFDRIPLWPARGNHEGRGPEFLQNFATPQGKCWYSFNYGQAHFICLDMYDDPEMFDWCRQDLEQCKARWKIAFFHAPIYNINDHASAARRDTYLPLFRKHGVDLVIAGHSHLYERFYPLRPSYDQDSKPITHIVSGGGGAPGRGELLSDPYLAASAERPHFLAITVDGDKLTCRAIDADGKVFDSLAMTHQGDAYDDAYMKLVKDETPLQLATVQLTMRSKASPTPGRPYTFDLHIPPSGVPGEVRVTLRIAPACAKSFKMTPEAVQAVVKPGEKCLVPITIITSQGVKRVQDWLEPELYFEYQYEYGDYRGTAVKAAKYWW
ncbi:MAG: metallophosphoesterase [Phycisphaerae bacterium]